ncbi:carbohydrate-binding family 9-like protein [Paenibacillus algorifonticola]|uniref:carbohydrate-binding family 9-like protein n=1 Tax=Paenibacillus algorifonticola TaxID=684063 RepID=UPI003D2A6312
MDSAIAAIGGSYICKRLVPAMSGASSASLDWGCCEALELVDTVTGAPPRERTEVRIGWSSKHLHIRFACRDLHIVSEFTQRDEPLYEQDVVEVFIDEEGEGRRYMELEVSPNNVVFDAIIENDGSGGISSSDLMWQFSGLQTSVQSDDQGNVLYFIDIPASNFQRPFAPGLVFHINLYRIDQDVRGTREYQAWRPTGAVNFHLPQHFGKLIFN